MAPTQRHKASCRRDATRASKSRGQVAGPGGALPWHQGSEVPPVQNNKKTQRGSHAHCQSWGGGHPTADITRSPLVSHTLLTSLNNSCQHASRAAIAGRPGPAPPCPRGHSGASRCRATAYSPSPGVPRGASKGTARVSHRGHRSGRQAQLTLSLAQPGQAVRPYWVLPAAQAHRCFTRCKPGQAGRPSPPRKKC